MEIKKNISLIAGLSIPVFMIIIVAVSIYLPAAFIHPQYNFVYSNGDSYYYDYSYFVNSKGFLERKVNERNSNDNYPENMEVSRLFYYDVTQNKPKEITYEEASQFKLDNSAISQDGFEINRGSNGGFLFFGHDDYNSIFLKKSTYSKKLSISQNGEYGFHFVGWIKK